MAPRARPVRILYMEDDAGLARLFEKSMQRVGYEVDVARDGEEGLAMFEADSHDVVAVDYKMPVRDGLDVIRKMASWGPLPPTVMLTGFGDEAVAVQAMKLGAGDYLVKDADGGYLQLLPAVIERLLEKQSLIEAERKATRALQESERRFRAVAESASDAIISFDPQGKVFFWNRRAQSMFGYAETQAIGRSLYSVIPRRLHRTVREQLGALAHAPGTSGVVELAGLRPDGSEFPAELSFSSWMNGPEIAYTTIVRDVTARKRAAVAMEQAARMEATATLARGIAHQFNNLMASVLGNVELLKIRLAEVPGAADRLDVIYQSAERAGELARQILTFARRGEYEPMVVNLAEIVRSSLDLSGPGLQERIQIDLDLGCDLWKIWADPTQMTQVVMNLASNAVEAIRDRGWIRIRAENVTLGPDHPDAPPDIKPGPYVRLRVEDSGQGMSQELMARVFEPFFTTKFMGRGLGMALVYSIVKNRGGTITVESEEGRGTCFTAYFPAIEYEIQSVGKAPVPAGSETILVVDDEMIFLSVAREMLERLGYRVLLACDGQEAVDILRTSDETIHLVLLDVHMPKMSGAEALPLLVEARPKTKVVVCSGAEDDASSRALLEAGARGFLRKPFGLDRLGTEVRRILDA